MKTTKSIKVGKNFNFLFLLLTLFYGCHASNKDIMQLQITFEDGFENDIVNVHVNDVQVAFQDTLNSGFSDGVTSVVLKIMERGDDYVVINNEQEFKIGKSENNLSSFFLRIILNTNQSEYVIDVEKGKYIGFRFENEKLEMQQNREKPMYD